MANVWYSNYPIPSSTSVWEGVWKLTRAMKKAGWTYKASSDGSAKDTTGTASNDKYGGNADPSSDTAMSIVNASWWVAEGPRTLRIPITAAPSGTFLRGETITQATSAAEGELMGFVWDSVGSSGYLAVLPRTGTFNNSNVITGSTSAATVTPTGTIITFAREVMFFKPGSSNVTLGTIYYMVGDVSADATTFFSYLAANAAGCTATVGPGMGGTGNGFPAKAWCIRGTAGAVGTHYAWFGNLTASFQTNFQICATNVTPATGVSADGTFWITATNSSVANSCGGFGLMRLDDTEPGDCDPWVFFRTDGTAIASRNYNTAGQSFGSQSYDFSITNLQGGTYPFFFGYQSKGHATLDVQNCYSGANSKAGSTHMMEFNADLAKPMRVLNSPATVRPMIIEPVAVATPGCLVTSSLQQVKGRCRWMGLASNGNTYDTFAGKTLLGVSVATTTTPCIVIGPYDGTTTPVQ
jgi:hypothetical protein